MRRCSRRAPTGVRNRALIAVLWRCGLRLGEALALAPKDLDPDQGTLVVQRGKGGKRRVVGVDAGTCALITRWLEVRRGRGISGRTLFCSLRDRLVAPALRLPLKDTLRDRCCIRVDLQTSVRSAPVPEGDLARHMNASIDRRRLRRPETLGRPHALVLSDGQQDRPHHPAGRAIAEVLRSRPDPPAGALDPLERVDCVLHAPAEAREVPHGDPTHLAALHHLDRAVPAAPRRVAARSVELLDHLDDVEPLASCDGLDLLALKLRRDEAVAFPGADPRDPYVPDRFLSCHRRAPFCRDCRVRRASCTPSSTSATRSRRRRTRGGSGRRARGPRTSTRAPAAPRTTSRTATRRS